VPTDETMKLVSLKGFPKKNLSAFSMNVLEKGRVHAYFIKKTGLLFSA
jgi:hypothetical protein